MGSELVKLQDKMTYIGVDACKAGWFAVTLTEEGNWKLNIFPNISSLWNQSKDARLILIDIPIGLRDDDSNERICDEEARNLLKSRRSSVFPAPCRDAIYADTYEKASEVNAQKTGRRLSKQVWGIIPKIREVDQLLLADMAAMSHIREIHPEICFWALNGSQPMKFSKKKQDGYLERREILFSVYPHAEALVDDALRYQRCEVARDDILDALVAAVTALNGRQGLSSIPQTPEIDSEGLPMEMVHFTDARTSKRGYRPSL